MIADDLEEIRDYFKMILERESDMQVAGIAASGEEAVRVAMELKPDIILMDIQMETDTAGITAIQKIKEELPNTKIIVLTIHEEDDLLFKAYSAGAIDYIVKTCSIVDIIGSIRNVYRNKLSLRPEIAEKILNEFSRMKKEQSIMIDTLNIISKLTNSEFEILKAIYGGHTYKQIAKERFVQEVTIRTQVNKILKKYDKKNMQEVVKLLKQLKVFDVYN